MRKILCIYSFLALVSCGNKVEEITDPSTGTVLKRYEYYLDENGQKVKNGTYTEWNPDGTLSWTSNYKDGKQEGEEIRHTTKDTIYYCNFKNNLRDGSFRLEYKDQVICQLNYFQGELDGKQYYYHSNGSLQIEGNMKNGNTIGIWKHYNENGKTMAVFHYNEKNVPKELVGRWNEQTDNGIEIYYLFDENGEMEYYAPLHRFTKKAELQFKATYNLDNELWLHNKSKMFFYNIISLKDDTLIVHKRHGDVKTWIKQN